MVSPDFRTEIIEWEQASDIFRCFTLLVDESELRWFKYVWKGFIKNGLASYVNDIERHWVLARIVTVGIMFNEFCELAWEEKCDADSLVLELRDFDDLFNPVLLGNMVEKNYLSEDGQESELFIEAVKYLVYKSRGQVFDALCKIFDHPTSLFVSLWLSPEVEIAVGKYSDELLDNTLNQDVTVNKCQAHDYVVNGEMFSLDA